MHATPLGSDLYVPFCTEQEGSSQPLATALRLPEGKNLCLQHFLQRCRTAQYLLTPEQRAVLPRAWLETLGLVWSQSPSGSYEGRPKGGQATLLVTLSGLLYKLHPASCSGEVQTDPEKKAR